MRLRPTERRRPGGAGLGELGTAELVDHLAGAHADVPQVVAAAAAETAAAVDLTVERLSAGGRLAYAGGGTPGLLAAADAAELPPTFGIPDERIAVVRTDERNDEDEPEHGPPPSRRPGSAPPTSRWRWRRAGARRSRSAPRRRPATAARQSWPW